MFPFGWILRGKFAVSSLIRLLRPKEIFAECVRLDKLSPSLEDAMGIDSSRWEELCERDLTCTSP